MIMFFELEALVPQKRNGSYCVEFDSIIKGMPEDFLPERPWGKRNSHGIAPWKFLRNNDRFILDNEIENKLPILVTPDGYLKCLK